MQEGVMEEKGLPSLLGIEIFGRDGRIISAKNELIKSGHSLRERIGIFISLINSLEEAMNVKFSEMFIKLKDYCGIFIIKDKIFVAHCKDEDAFEYVERMIATIE